MVPTAGMTAGSAAATAAAIPTRLRRLAGRTTPRSEADPLRLRERLLERLLLVAMVLRFTGSVVDSVSTVI